MQDIRLNNDIAIHVHGFDTKYVNGPNGELIERDMVTYSPLGDAKTTMHREIRVLEAVLPIEDCGDNLAFLTANRLWTTIEPQYRAWKAKEAIPEHGTPLGSWAGITRAQADILKNIGLRTVEEVAAASDIVMTKTQLANAIRLRDQARAFVETTDKAKDSAQFATLKSENEELRAQMLELMQTMQQLMAEKQAAPEPKRRGRPPNPPADEPATPVEEPIAA